MSKEENIHVGYVVQFKNNDAIIQVSGKDYYVSLTNKETNFLYDMLYNAKLSYIAFDIANHDIITYESFQSAMGEKNSREVYITFINMFKN